MCSLQLTLVFNNVLSEYGPVWFKRVEVTIIQTTNKLCIPRWSFSFQYLEEFQTLMNLKNKTRPKF